MKVGELIRKLQELPPDTEVLLQRLRGPWGEEYVVCTRDFEAETLFAVTESRDGEYVYNDLFRQRLYSGDKQVLVIARELEAPP